MAATIGEKVYDQLFTRIRQGRYRSQLPTEKDLAGELGVNVKTVAKALQSLASQGVVERRRKRGTVVCTRSDAPVRPAVNVLWMTPDVFAASNPWRHRVNHFIERLWWEMGRRHIPVHLMPPAAEQGGLARYVSGTSASDHVVVFGTRPMRLFEELAQAGYWPVAVGVDRDYYPALRSLPMSAIDQRFEDSFDRLVKHLHERGRSRIALLAHPVKRDVTMTYGKNRQAMLVHALHDVGLELDRRLLVTAPRGEDARGVQMLLDRNVPFDALLCEDNESARLALEVLRQAGRRVPDDVAVACFSDDIDGPSYRTHCFTCMQMDTDGYVEEIARMVAEGVRFAGTVYRPARLVLGQTT